MAYFSLDEVILRDSNILPMMKQQQQQLLQLDKKDKQSSSWLQHAHYRNTKRYFLFLLLSSIN
jgi:hypothetical protein